MEAALEAPGVAVHVVSTSTSPVGSMVAVVLLRIVAMALLCPRAPSTVPQSGFKNICRLQLSIRIRELQNLTIIVHTFRTQVVLLTN